MVINQVFSSELLDASAIILNILCLVKYTKLSIKIETNEKESFDRVYSYLYHDFVGSPTVELSVFELTTAFTPPYFVNMQYYSMSVKSLKQLKVDCFSKNNSMDYLRYSNFRTNNF